MVVISNTIVIYFIIGIALMITIGCGEAEDPVAMEVEGVAGTLGTLKIPEAAPAAPTLQVPEGTPTVQSVGYYSDWKLTKPLEGTVPTGKTIFIKVVFSEGMKLVVADDKTARPILYRKVAGKLTRFRIAGFGAKGKDFVSGDAKPIKNQASYLCKYVVQKEDTGKFVFAVGKWSVDKQGNTLPAFYTHNEQLQCGPPTTKKPATPKPGDDTTSPTVESIAHSYDGNPIAEGESVPAGTTIETQIVFSERVVPAVTYTTGGKTKAYTTSQTVGGVHWRGICKPTDKSGTIWLCRQSTAQPSFSVTVTTDTVDTAGNPLAEATTTPEIPVTKPVVKQPQKPVQPPVDDTPIIAPEEPTQQPGIVDPDDPIHLEKAIAVAKRCRDRVVNENIQTHNNELDNILMEETGLRYYNNLFEKETLLAIYAEENPQDQHRIWSGNRSVRGLMVEYMRLYFAYPNKTKDEILDLFRQSCKNGKVSIEYGQFFI